MAIELRPIVSVVIECEGRTYIAEQIISDFQHSEELAWEMVERAMRLAIEATASYWAEYNGFGPKCLVPVQAWEGIAARMAELLKAKAKR